MRLAIVLCTIVIAMNTAMSHTTSNRETAVLAGGCFWCIEAVFERIDGVTSVEAGYTGGTKENPTYEEVCTGKTGHAEAALITYDPSKVTFDSLLHVFWEAHDPTTLNRQGGDVGTQYRSAIFYQTAEQQASAERSKKEAQKSFDTPIMTEIVPLKEFFKAEDYHQDYFKNHPNAPYCVFVIKPKLHKLKLQ
jgi:peptide-methionine (S)-S-oxide reductase